MKENAELWSKIRPFALWDLSQILEKTKRIASSSGENVISLIGNQDVKQYTPDEDGIRGAVESANTDDVIVLPRNNIQLTSPLTLKDYLIIIGSGTRHDSYWTPSGGSGFYSLSDLGSPLITSGGSACVLMNVHINYYASSTSSLTAILSTNGLWLLNSHVYCTNNGTGYAYGIYSAGGSNGTHIYGCTIRAGGNTGGATAVCLYQMTGNAANHIRDTIMIGESTNASGIGCRMMDNTEIMDCEIIGSNTGLFVGPSVGG